LERFIARVAKHYVIGLDTNIFIYHLEQHPRYQPLTQALLLGVQAGRQKAITSVITVMELTVHPWKSGTRLSPVSTRCFSSIFPISSWRT